MPGAAAGDFDESRTGPATRLVPAWVAEVLDRGRPASSVPGGQDRRRILGREGKPSLRRPAGRGEADPMSTESDVEIGPHEDEPHQESTGALLNWLRAAVLGANDGIVSTAGIVMGVAGATTDRTSILIAGLAGLVAGALSMAAGEYVSVSTQRDTEKALIAKETPRARRRSRRRSSPSSPGSTAPRGSTRTSPCRSPNS